MAEGRDQELAGLARLESGVPRLDDILKGGFVQGSIYTVFGSPGSGKTIFANQICFNHIKRGGRCVYVTMLVESHAKMLNHLSVLNFFDASKVADAIYYVSAYGTLKQHGFSEMLDLIRKTVKDRKADLLVIDGLESAEQISPSTQLYREFIHELQAFATLLGCTTLLLSTATDSQIEESLVDGIIELSDTLVGPRAVRELTVKKFRGSGYLRGRHEVEILESGISIHPRTEIEFDRPPEAAGEKRVRMAFGIPRLDQMLYGGLPSGSTTTLLGAPGTGKTLLGLSFLVEGAKQGQQGIYFGFYEPPPRLCEKADQVGIPLRHWCEKGLIKLVWQPPLEHIMDSLAEQIFERIRDSPSPRRRLFIDGVEGFRAAAVYQNRMPRFLSALTNQLRTHDVTTVMTEELELFSTSTSIKNPELASVAEGVIMLRYVELRSQLYRLISIMKMRETRYDTAIREFRILDKGIEVAESFESAEAILSGLPRLRETGGSYPPAPGKSPPSEQAPGRGGR
jgi:circadian clock protein KaiC